MSSGLRLIFAGTPEFAAVALRALIGSPHEIVAVYTQPDKPAGRGHKLIPSAVKQVALSANLPVFQPKSLRDPLEQERLRSFNADVMVVAAYGLILPQAVLDIPRYGCLNIHGSLLPRWRGAAPIHRALLAGDTQTGITIMQMEAGLDTGPMLRKVLCPITATDTSPTLHDTLAALGAQALLATLEDVQHERVQPEIQNDALTTYAHKMTKEDACIDWQQAANVIERQVRACYAWPVAYTHVQDQLLRIWQAQVLDESTTATPGTVLRATKHGLDVATSGGVLRLLTLQLPGHKAMAASAMLNGYSHLFTVGTILV